MEVDGYEITSSVARGPAATVYQAFEEGTGHPVALKVLFDAKPGDYERFEKEMAALDVLRGHPNIVELRDRGFVDNMYAYMALEWAAGGDAEALIASNALQPSDVALVAEQVLTALGAAHSTGILHRDIKPSNVLFGRGAVLLSDFGIARITENSVTHTSTFAGTVPYSAPETLARSESSVRSDLYSLGATALTLCTKRLPFSDMNRAFAAAMTGEQLDTSDVPEPLGDWVSWLTAPRPEDRPGSTDEALGRLRELGLAAPPSAGLAAALEASPPVVRPSVLSGSASVPLGHTVAHGMTEVSPSTEMLQIAPRAKTRPESSRAIQVVLALIVLAVVGTVGLTAFAKGNPASGTGTDETVAATVGTGTAETLPVVTASTSVVPTASTSIPADSSTTTESETVTTSDGGSSDGNREREARQEEQEETVPSTVSVPDVVGRAQNDAIVSIERVGLRAGVATEPHRSVAVGLVIRQTTPAGLSIARGSEVSVVVSSGPAMVAVPNVVDLMSGQAIALLADRGLQATTEQRADRDRPVDVVAEQSTSAGEELAEGSSIVLVVSTGPPEVTVPVLDGLSVDEAIALLADHGLEASVRLQRTRDRNHGEIIEQDPVGGQTAIAGSVVTLVSAEWPPCRLKTSTYERKLFKFIPDHTRGDRDFDGNGPSVTFEFNLEVDSSSVVAVATMTAAELWQNNSDSTMAQGTQRTELAKADNGWKIVGIDIPHAATIKYVDTDHDIERFGAQGPLEDTLFIGDSNGDDAGVTTQVHYRIRTFTVSLEESSLCLPS